MKKAIVLLALLIVCGSVAVADSPPPFVLKDIPVYQGAVRDANREKSHIQQITSSRSKDQNFVSFDALEFTTDAAAETVLLWYLKTYDLGPTGREAFGTTSTGVAWGTGIAEDKVKSADVPGTWSRITWGIDALRKYAEQEFDSSLNSYMLSTYAAKRKQVAGLWVAGAFLQWTYIDSDANVRDLAIRISDASFEKFTKTSPSYEQKSIVTLSATTTLSEKNIAEANRKAQAAQAATRTAIPAGEPTAAYLTVAVYPGAKFAAEESKINQAQGQAFFAWASNDSVETIIDYYEKATGAKRVAISPTGFTLTKLLPAGGGVIVTVLPAKETQSKDPVLVAAKTAFAISKF